MIETGDAWTFAPACAIYAETPTRPSMSHPARIIVTGEVDFVHYAHGWFRVRYRLNGIPNDQHECFRLPVAAPDEAPIKYGFRHGDAKRGAYDTRYNIK